MKWYLKSPFVWLLLASLAFASGGSVEQPPGEPPFGLKIQGDTKGTKLDGVISIEFYDCAATTAGTVCDARTVLRLRQGTTNALKMFFGETEDILASSPLAVQTAITNSLQAQVVNAFFPGQNLTTKLKNVTNFGSLTVATTDLTPAGSIFILADVQIAVN